MSGKMTAIQGDEWCELGTGALSLLSWAKAHLVYSPGQGMSHVPVPSAEAAASWGAEPAGGRQAIGVGGGCWEG